MAESETKAKATPAKPVEKKETKAKAFYFKAVRHAGLTIQVQKMVKKQDGTEEQVVDHQETFTQYYDTFKGDTIRVGYLKTSSPKVAELCEADGNVETISAEEYNKAVKELDRAPVPAV